MIRLLSALLVPLDRLLARLVGGGFGLKDVFTIVNLAGGVASICFAIQGNLWWAAFAVMLGYLGDVLDGPVARLTGRQNRFGNHLDNIADHTSQCVAPAFVIFLAYRDVSLGLAFAMASLLIITGSIRHARGETVRFEFDLAWNGLPRPVGAFLVLSFVNSQLFHQVPAGRWVGVGLVALVSVLHLIPLPYMNHHGRPLQLYVKLVVIGWFAACAAAALFFTRFFWDVLLGCTFLYAAGSWIPMTREERRAFFVAARKWRQALDQNGSPSEAPGTEEA